MTSEPAALLRPLQNPDKLSLFGQRSQPARRSKSNGDARGRRVTGALLLLQQRAGTP